MACGLTIRSVRIDVTSQSGTDVDRGYDPVAGDGELRGNASQDRVRELLSHFKRDLAVTLAGISAEQLHRVYRRNDPENRQDENSADRLSDNVSLGKWKIMDVSVRPKFSDREQPQAYKACMESFVDNLMKMHANNLNVLATSLEVAISISGEEAHRILEESGVQRGSVTTDALP